MKSACLGYAAVIAFLILSAGVLMHVSQNVQKLEREIALCDQAIDKENEKIRVLNAEWAYLNNPQRLEEIASGGYNMKMPGAKELIGNSANLPDFLAFVEPSSGGGAKADKANIHPQTQRGRQ